MCCGSRRATIRPPPPGTRPALPSVIAPQSDARSPVEAQIGGLATLRYLQAAPIRVVGPATGRAYAFSASRPVQMVDARDAQILGRATVFSLD